MLKKTIWITSILLVCFVLYNLIVNFYTIYPKKKFFPKATNTTILEKDRIEQAIAKIEEYLNISPNDLEKNVELGIYYFLKGPKFYDRAINLLDNAWRIGALDERIFYYLGIMYEFLKLYNFAIIEYKKYLNNVKNDLEIEIRLANLYYITGKQDDAIMVYERILEKEPENIIAMTNLAMIFFEKQNYSDARDYLIKVKNICKKNIILEPKNVNFYIGRLHFINKNYNSAIEFFKEELNLYKENNLEVKIFLAKSYFELKDFANANLYAKEVLKVSPENKEIKILMSRIKK